MHDVIVEMNCELTQRHASSVALQLPNVMVVVEVRQGMAQALEGKDKKKVQLAGFKDRCFLEERHTR